MSKDPAFLFYTADWLTGTMLLNFEDKGKYMQLLAYMHQNGRLCKETIRLLVGSVSVNLAKKFEIDSEGLLYNERLESEVKKRSTWTESRRNNGKKGGRPTTYNAINQSVRDKKNTKIELKINDNHMVNHMEDENENENEDINEDINIIKRSKKIKKSEIVKTENLELISLDPLVAIWTKWIKYKKDQFKFTYKSMEAEKSAKTELLNLSGGSHDLANEIIEQSMANGYRGLFELKNKNGKQIEKPSRNKQTTIDAYNEIIQDRLNKKLAANEI